MSIKLPLVSVLINNYNYARFLGDGIESALAQDYANFEVIVVDDGSTDHSRAVIEPYGDRLISVFKPNGGQASAVNAGFKASRGEIVCFLDSDDYWLPNKVSRVVETALAHPEALLIYHRVQDVDRDGHPQRKPWPLPLYQGRYLEHSLHSGGWWPYPPMTGLSFRRGFLEKVMEMPEQPYRTCADSYMADLVPFFGPVVGIGEALSCYRLHGANAWHSSARLPEEAMRKNLGHHEMRVRELNRALVRLGLNYQVSLEDHMPYQYTRYKLGAANRRLLSGLALRFPWLTGIQRLRGLAGLWLRPVPALAKLSQGAP